MRHARRLQDADVEQALATPAHRALLAACIRGPRSARELQSDTGLAQATLYRNLKALVDRGVLVVERSAMTADGKPYDLFRSRLRAARLVVDADGTRVEWEANAPVEERLLSLWDALRS